MNKDTLTQIKAFQKKIRSYVKNNRRDLPWRAPHLRIKKDNSIDPYQILVSEIMLQQTQTSRVIAKYKSFLKRFPNVKKLAEANLKDVLLEWQGLGYNRRGMNLKKAAEVIVCDFEGHVPSDKESLISLPGIGPYTAGAIRAFAFNEPDIFIETNIRTAFLHHFFNDASCKQVHDKELIPFIEATLDKKNPRNWYSALMDYGAHLKQTIGNINIKSRHYSKQSTFSGSNRELRSQILKALLIQPETVVTLSKKLERPRMLISENLISMKKEGLLQNTGSRYVVT